MHRIISFLLVISILSTAFSRWMFVAGYEMNSKYIADKLCVNKAKPMMHCNGKCYLAKKIKASEEKEKAGGSQKERFLDVFLMVDAFSLDAPFKQAAQLMHSEPACNLPERASLIFQPPRA